MAALTLYGSAVASAVAPTTACQMSTATGGTETSKNTVFSGGASIWGELTSQGGTVSTSASIPAPTGKGWVYSTGAGSFATGNWSAACNIGSPNGGSATANTIRFYRYSSGTYTLIGSITSSHGTIGKTLISFASTSFTGVTLAAGDLLYVDIWWQDNNTQADGDTGAIYESTSGTAGVASDMQVTTPSFTASGGGGVTLTGESDGVATANASLTVSHSLTGASDALASASASLTISHPLVGEADGVSTATATLTVAHALVGESDGVATGAAALTVSHALAGAANGAATASASLTVTHALAGASDGVSTATAGLLTGHGMSGESDGLATASATLTISHSLGGESDGTSTASATLAIGTPAVQLAGMSSGQATAVALLTLTHLFAGAAAGVSGASASLSVGIIIPPPPDGVAVALTSSGPQGASVAFASSGSSGASVALVAEPVGVSVAEA